MIYETLPDGRRKLARDSRLWLVLHARPNDIMTPRDFWSTMIMHWAMRGNAYAQIIRDSSGDLVSLWLLSPDQTEVFVDSKGQVAYKYQKDGKTYILGVNDVLHIKDIGNGLIGLSKLSFMSSSVKEATDTQKFATANAENYGKPSGILTVDHILKKENKNGVNERERIRQSLYGRIFKDRDSLNNPWHSRSPFRKPPGNHLPSDFNDFLLFIGVHPGGL